jgi:DNA-directed RNA polymerase specialized sigma24 family protein
MVVVFGDTGPTAVVKPLTKRTKETQVVYHRREEVERQIERVHSLKSSQIFELLQTSHRSEPDYLFDETIVYLIRERRAGGDVPEIEAFYRVLNVRVWRLLNKYRSKFGDRANFEDFGQQVGIAILDKIFDIESDSADYAQVNFGDYAVAAAQTIWKRRLVSHMREDQHSGDPRDGDDDEADPISEISAGETKILEQLIITEAIRSLPEHLKTVAVLLADGWKIESNDPTEPTISRQMRVSSRTIRNWVIEAREILDEYKGGSR